MPSRRHERDPGVDTLARILIPPSRAILGLRGSGADNLPASGPVIVCANHVSLIDPVIVGRFVYESGRNPYFLAKEALFRNPVAGAILRRGGQIPVDRRPGQGGDALGAAKAALAEGRTIIMYPEGTLTRDPGLWPMTGRFGAARLALDSGATVVPIAHWGVHEVLPRGVTIPRLVPRRTVAVRCGEPLDLAGYAGRPASAEVLEAVTAEIMAAITTELSELRGEEPPGEPFTLERTA